MWNVVATTQFKKDLKRYRNQADKISALNVVIKSLRETGTVPAEYKPHYLSGNWSGYMECHVKNDFLLIWLNAESNEIRIVRLGTHSELFGK